MGYIWVQNKLGYIRVGLVLDPSKPSPYKPSLAFPLGRHTAEVSPTTSAKVAVKSTNLVGSPVLGVVLRCGWKRAEKETLTWVQANALHGNINYVPEANFPPW
jgi:hypothetical protein